MIITTFRWWTLRAVKRKICQLIPGKHCQTQAIADLQICRFADLPILSLRWLFRWSISLGFSSLQRNNLWVETCSSRLAGPMILGCLFIRIPQVWKHGARLVGILRLLKFSDFSYIPKALPLGLKPGFNTNCLSPQEHCLNDCFFL